MDCAVGFTFNQKLMEKKADHLLYEDRLMEKERNQQALLKKIPVGIFLTDANGVCFYVNEYVCKIYGLPPEEIKGMKWLNGIHPEDRAIVLNECLRCGQNKEIFKMEYRIQQRNGESIWVLGEANPYLDQDNELSFVGTMSDITEIKQANEKLNNERQKLFALLDNLPLMIYIVSKDYSIDFANRTFRDKMDMSQNNPCYKAIKNRNEPCEDCHPHKLFNGQKYDIWERTLGGKTFQVYAYPFDDGGVPKVLVLGIDISEFKTAKASLDSFQQEMARLERLHLVGEIAASLGHEVRNPMTTVRGFLQMLKEKEGCLPYREYFDLMISELDRSDSLIRDFLSLAKTGTMKREIRNLNEMIEKVSPLIHSDSLNSGKSVVLDLNPTTDLLLDEKEIHQLVFNLARNGLESMPGGGKLLIKTFQEKEEVILVIRDEGHGINPGILDKIGTPFVTTKESGTGLGLAVCYGIAKRNDADINFETGPTGTSFYVKFNKATYINQG
ncbi:MAG: PAS domain S-box protein [Bacillota bacterium]